MPILWLRVALGFYAVGLIYALVALTRRSHLLDKVALPAMTLGMVFQFVSLTEAMLLSGQLTLTSVHNSESFLAFLVMTGFMIVYLTYRTTSPGIVVAQATFGRVDFLDPKVLLSVLMWAVYMIMLYTRWNAGWRGRRAAYLATGAFVAAVVAWAANYFSTIHRFVQS